MRYALKISAAVTALSAALALSSPSQASPGSVYSAQKNFSITSGNPNGSWAYGYGTTGTTFNLDAISGTDLFGSGDIYWQGPDVARYGLFDKNNSGSTEVFSTIILPDGTLLMHPGVTSDTIARWTAPGSGTFHYSGSFTLLDTSPTGVVGLVYKDGSQLFSSTLTGPAAPAGGSAAFSGNVSLSAGDKLYFGVNNFGNVNDDATGLIANISAVPEPSDWALMLVGIGGLGAMLRYRKKVRPAAIAG